MIDQVFFSPVCSPTLEKKTLGFFFQEHDKTQEAEGQQVIKEQYATSYKAVQ